MRKKPKPSIRLIASDTPDEIAFPLVIARLKAGTSVTDRGCWHSGRTTNGYGYVQLFFRGKRVSLHRLSFEAHKGPIPDGLCVLHACDNRQCWNPDHLFLGTVSDNKQDELQKGRNYEANRTHCPRGHAYAEHGKRVGANQWRTCVICTRARMRLKAGWPEELAYSMEPVSPGLRPIAARWKRAS